MNRPIPRRSSVPPSYDPTYRFGRSTIIALVLVGSLVIALLLGGLALWGIHTARRTLVDGARQDALALLESLALAAQYSVETGAVAERLESEARETRLRLIAGQLGQSPSAMQTLRTLSNQYDNVGLTVWYRGASRISYPEEIGRLMADDPLLGHESWMTTFIEADNYQLIDSVNDARWTGLGMPTGWGGMILWEYSEGMESAPALGGIGQLIQQIGEASDINYIMLQAPDGIVFASRPLNPVLKLVEDTFLIAALEANSSATREIEFEGVPVMEAAKPFLSEELPSGMFRVGVSLTGVEEAENRLTWQFGISALLFALMASLLIAFLLSRRSLVDLARVHRRIETMNTRILDSMDQGVIAVDDDGTITVFNPAAEQITGIRADDAVGKQARDILSTGDYQLHETNDAQSLTRDRERRLKTAEGVRELVYTTTPMISPAGHRDGAVAVIRDETESRALAALVHRAERLSEMGHLAAGVAHEIRNPLNAIALAAQRLRLEVTDSDSRTLAATVWEESKRLNTIIEDYLSLARPSHEPKEAVDFSMLVNSVCDMVRMETEKSGITLILAVTDNLQLNAASNELKKALWNVLSNAIAATNEGGQITVTAARQDSNFTLTIDDTGEGIDEQDTARVFQPYFTTKSGGTGLGLAITHRIIADHNGTIDLQSPVPGTEQGTRVTITLPLS